MENIFYVFFDMSYLAVFSLFAVMGNVIWIIFMISTAINEYKDDYDYKRKEPKNFRDFLKRESSYLYLCIVSTFMTAQSIMIVWLFG